MGKILKLKSTNIGLEIPEEEIYPITSSEAVYNNFRNETTNLKDSLFAINKEIHKEELNLNIQYVHSNDAYTKNIVNDTWLLLGDGTEYNPPSFSYNYAVVSKTFNGKSERLPANININIINKQGIDTSSNSEWPLSYGKNTIKAIASYHKFGDDSLELSNITKEIKCNCTTSVFYGFGDENTPNVNTLNHKFVYPGNSTIELRGEGNTFKYIYIFVPDVFNVSSIIQVDALNMKLDVDRYVDTISIGQNNIPYNIYMSKIKIKNKNKQLKLNI